MTSNRGSELDSLERLWADVDLRMFTLLLGLSAEGELTLPLVVAYMRSAYGLGYTHALTERKPGELHREHGFRVPSRRAARV